MSSKKRIKASSSGFMWGRIPVSSSPGSCLRNILIKEYVNEGSIPAKYQEMGARNEQRYQEIMSNNPDIDELTREVNIEIDLGDSHYLRGRYDYAFRDKRSNRKVVVELKSADSKRTLSDVIKKGKVKTDNLAQLVTYIAATKADDAYLIYTYFPDNITPTEERIFTVQTSDTGEILVDSQLTGFTVKNWADHLNAAAYVIKTNTFWENRPLNHDLKWKSVCTYCPWNDVCTKFDTKQITSLSEVINSAEQSIERKKNERESSSTEV